MHRKLPSILASWRLGGELFQQNHTTLSRTASTARPAVSQARRVHAVAGQSGHCLLAMTGKRKSASLQPLILMPMGPGPATTHWQIAFPP